MKPDEEVFFKTSMTVHPDFLEAKTWIPGPEPPDVILTDIHERKLGIELTEWLDERQTTPSIADKENEMKWLAVLGRHPKSAIAAVHLMETNRLVPYPVFKALPAKELVGGNPARKVGRH